MSTGPDTIRILHVDDDPDFAEVVATFLERENDQLDVRTATSAAEGLEILTHNGVDCIVSDYEMPGQNGIKFLEAVREEYPELPFILYTGKGSEEVASEAIRKGVSDYLQKDSGAERYALLANRIQNAVEQVRATRRARAQRRINTVVRKSNEALVRATTRREIDERVCEIISNAEPYQFAWIGEHDTESGAVEPRASAGIGENYLNTIEITTDESPTGRGPTGRAIQNRELRVMQNIPEDPQYEPWRERALDRNYRSSAAVPLVYDDTLYGVLNVYADRTHAFDDRERQLLSSLGETIAHAYHRIELQQQYTDQYRTLFEEAPVMIVFTRAVEGEPVIEDCNRAFAERLGYTKGELRGTRLADYYTEDSDERLVEGDGYQRALTGEFIREQRTLVTRDGDEVLTVLRASPRLDRDGDIIGTHAMYLDITEEQQIQELEQTNALLTTLGRALPHGVLAEDESREVLAVNQRMFDLFEFPERPEDIVGADCERLAEDVSEMFVDSKAFVERIGELVTRHEPVDNEVLRLTDGRTFERSYRPIQLPDGRGHLWMYTDSTEQIEYQETLQELQYRTRALISSETETEVATTAVEIAEETLGFPLSGIHLVDDERERLVPVAVTDGIPEHLGQEPVYERTTPSRSADAFNWKVFESGEPAIIESVSAHPAISTENTPSRSGIVYPLGDHGLFITSSPEPNAFDENDVTLVEVLATVVTAVLDRTEREEELRDQKQRLQAKTERLDAFTGVISHDLRNPLSVAEGRLELAHEECDSEHLVYVEQSHDRMRALIEDLLALARDGEAVTEREPVALGTIAGSCWSNVETANASLLTDSDRTIRADKSRLKQLFENLMRNAIEHGGDDVTVTIGDLDDGFYIEDDGPGIPEADRETVFEVSYSTAQGGTGLGLSIVKQIAEAHGWDIRVTEGSDRGARFEITGVEFADQ